MNNVPRALVISLLLSTLLPSSALGRTVTVNCARPGELASALAADRPGRALEIVLEGVCHEHVLLRQDDVTIRAGSPGSGVSAPDATQDTLQLDAARRVVLDGLTITGGRNGIAAVRGASLVVRGATIQGAAVNGIVLRSGASALVDRSTVEDHGGAGIEVGGGQATITSSVVRANGTYGIFVTSASNARIGFADDGTGAGNLIEGNRLDGVLLANASAATLYGNTIQGNGAGTARHGVLAVQNSVIRLIGLNTIRDNHGAGVFVRGSTLQTGRGDFSITPATNDVSSNVGFAGIVGEHNATLDLRDGLTVANNQGNGISVGPSASLLMRNTTVSGNTGTGVAALNNGALDIAASTINGNGVHGIFLHLHSSLNIATSTVANNANLGMQLARDSAGVVQGGVIVADNRGGDASNQVSCFGESNFVLNVAPFGVPDYATGCLAF